MDEAAWLACDDPEAVFGYLHRVASDRKRRLYLCAVCRWWRGHVRDLRLWRVVDAAEQFAEGRAPADCLAAARQEAAALLAEASQEHQNWFWNAWPGREVTALQIQLTCLATAAILPDLQADWHKEDSARLALSPDTLRCIFGNPFHPFFPHSEWHTPAIRSLALAAYDHRTLPAGALDADRLAVLADALEDAGCTDTPLLTHLRSPYPHVRGCHVIDALLDKS